MPDESAPVGRCLAFPYTFKENQVVSVLQSLFPNVIDRWAFHYDRTIASGHNGMPYSYQVDGKGSLRREELELVITLKNAGLDAWKDYEFADVHEPTEVYFKHLELSEPFGWRGGCPSREDRKLLRSFAEAVVSAIKRGYSVEEVTL